MEEGDKGKLSRGLEALRFEIGEVKGFQNVQWLWVGKDELSPPTATIELSLL